MWSILKGSFILMLISLLVRPHFAYAQSESEVEKVPVAAAKMLEKEDIVFLPTYFPEAFPTVTTFPALGFQKSTYLVGLSWESQTQVQSTGQDLDRDGTTGSSNSKSINFDSNFTGSDWVTLPVALVILIGVGRISLFITTGRLKK